MCWLIVVVKIMKQLLQTMNVNVFVGVTCPALFMVVLMVVVIRDSVQETFGLLPPLPLTDCGANQARRHQIQDRAGSKVSELRYSDGYILSGFSTFIPSVVRVIADQLVNGTC